MPRVLVRGFNEFGSAIAFQLFHRGVPVLLHDRPLPDDCRRTTSFTDAVWLGSVERDGVSARRIDDPRALEAVIEERSVIPLVVEPIEAVLAAYRPDVLIDARMRKREVQERQRGLAPLTVGLGPGFVAGEQVDLIVETGFGEDFARVSDRGATRPQSGEPGKVNGVGRQRFVYAPAAGLFRTSLEIGALVQPGDVTGTLDGTPVLAPVAGALAALVHDNVPVKAGVRLLIVEPRGPEAITRGIGQRQAQLASLLIPRLEERLGIAAG